MLLLLGDAAPTLRGFWGSSRVYAPNGISIGSAGFAVLTTVTDRQTDRHIDHATYVAIIVRSRKRVEFKIACLAQAHQSLTSTAPTYLSADIQLVSEHGRRHLRSSSYRTLAVPRTRTTLGDRSFAVAGPRVWNSLAATLRQITSYGQFRQHRKTHLFRA